MRTKQVRPAKLAFEIEIYISRQNDPVTKRDYIDFDFNTVKVFESFKYKLNVIEKIDLEKKEISFLIEGLSAPLLSLPEPGPAKYRYRLFDFKNTEYTLKLTKKGLEKNIYKFKVTQSRILFTRQPSKKFVNVFPKSKPEISVS